MSAENSGDGAFRSLAHDGARRAEVREASTGVLIDYSHASWDEWFTLAAVAEACADLAVADG